MSLFDRLPKILPFAKNQQASEYFFSLIINFHTLIGAVWGIEGNKVRIVSSAESEYSSDEELTHAANVSLDEALANFQPEPTKLLFGVPDVWLQDETIKPEYLRLLKQMVKELEVSPMAYVSSTHAICHLLQKQQGIPVTAILVEISDPLIVTIVKSGKIIGSKAQKRSSNLPDDIEKALLTFSNVEVLPSKIFVFSLSEDENTDKFKDE